MGTTRWVLWWTFVWGGNFFSIREGVWEKGTVIGSFGDKVFLGFGVGEIFLKPAVTHQILPATIFFVIWLSKMFEIANTLGSCSYVRTWKNLGENFIKKYKNIMSQKRNTETQNNRSQYCILTDRLPEIFVINTRGRPGRRFSRAWRDFRKERERVQGTFT